jgi:poly-gamma-glutamate synthesis protein (capsule biosynthesis protein)
VVVAFSGDVLATHATWVRAHANAGGHGYDYRPMFARLRSLVSSADVAICHLETPLTGPGLGVSDYPRYVVPHEVAGAIRWAGYDGCSTASNHTLDAGSVGIRTTLGWLDQVGLRHTGSARSAKERWKTTHYRVGDLTVAHLSFTASFNGLVPARSWEANRIDTARIVSDARLARRRGADIVVLSLHWGTEHQHAPSASQLALAETLSRSGAIDLIVGHHAHVIQPVRRPLGRWVAYGLGNSLSGMTASMFTLSVTDGVVLLATFERGPHGWHVRRLRYAPTWVEPGSWIVRLVGPAIDAGQLPSWELAELRRSWGRTVLAIDAARLDVVPYRRATV